MTPACPLCGAPHPLPFHQDARRTYLRCARCDLVFVPAGQHLTPDDERAQYDLHDNRIDDPGYRRFLSRAADPVLQAFVQPARGLDVGCGPGPALAAMLTEAGHTVAVWDPIYQPDPAPLQRTWDFVTCTEVVEHARDPAALWALLGRCVRPGGLLVVMSKRWTSSQAFAAWHYIHDPTHIAFHHDRTLIWVADRLGLELDLTGPDVAVLRRREPRTDACT